MRLSKTKSKTSTSYFVIEDVFIDGKRTTRTVEKLGNDEYIKLTFNTENPEEWARAYVNELKKEKKSKDSIMRIPFSAEKQLPRHSTQLVNGGYLFLQAIYYELQIHKICSSFTHLREIEFDINQILSRLIYSRVLYPQSTQSVVSLSKQFIESSSFELHQMYRALEIITKNFHAFVSNVYQIKLDNSTDTKKTLYYDFANYYFEVESEEGMLKYGATIDNLPSPVVQMGLFMDENGMPLAMNLNFNPARKHTIPTSIQQRLSKDFQSSQLICFSDTPIDNTFATSLTPQSKTLYLYTQPLKTLSNYLKEWTMEMSGWKFVYSSKMYHLREILDTIDNPSVYYKERWIDNHGMMQRLVVTFSPVSKNYHRSLRQSQILHTEKFSKVLKHYQHPETSTKNLQENRRADDFANLNYLESIIEEESYHGFYAVITNLNDDISEILKLTRRRWDIEENFRVMQNELRTHPVYLKREDRIRAHFITCYLSLLIQRSLEYKLRHQYSCQEIVSTLESMNFVLLKGHGYLPLYQRTSLTDSLHQLMGFNTDTEIIPVKKMNDIILTTKSSKKGPE